MQKQLFAYSYRPIIGTNYNILEGKIKLFEDPLEPGNYPLFANCTLKEPLKDKKGFVISFNIEKDEWEYIENHIGEEGYIKDNPYIIEDYGPIPDGFTNQLSLNKQYELRKEEVDSICKTILNRTDYLLMPDYQLDVESKNQIIEFRHLLRSLDKKEEYPFFNQEIPIPDWPLKNKKCSYLDILSLIKK